MLHRIYLKMYSCVKEFEIYSDSVFFLIGLQVYRGAETEAVCSSCWTYGMADPSICGQHLYGLGLEEGFCSSFMVCC